MKARALVDNSKELNKTEFVIAEIFGKGAEFRRIMKRINKIKKMGDHNRTLEEINSLDLPLWHRAIQSSLGELYYEAYSKGVKDMMAMSADHADTS